MTWVLLVSSLGFFHVTIVHIHSLSLPLPLSPSLHTACKVGNKASNFRCNARIWNSSNLRQPGNYSFADGKLSEGNGKMNHKRCGTGVKAMRLRQNFSVTNPGPAFVSSLSLTSKILGLNFRFLKTEKQCWLTVTDEREFWELILTQRGFNSMVTTQNQDNYCFLYFVIFKWQRHWNDCIWFHIWYCMIRS